MTLSDTWTLPPHSFDGDELTEPQPFHDEEPTGSHYLNTEKRFLYSGWRLSTTAPSDWDVQQSSASRPRKAEVEAESRARAAEIALSAELTTKYEYAFLRIAKTFLLGSAFVVSAAILLAAGLISISFAVFLIVAGIGLTLSAAGFVFDIRRKRNVRRV